MKLVRTLEAVEVATLEAGASQQRRVAILQRDDGYFSFALEYAYKSEYEGEVIAEGWHHRYGEGIFESEDAAEHAGRSALASRYRVQNKP
ncbi:hypothetical protein ACQR1I_13990 [Bradyrhizobium sp. HKCCYLS2038]|uniref:hypothetical protein n=1 Tax=unclassified Bradyrhizobium TaxID=2631580 RepID=UPI003EBCC2A4